MHFHYTIPEPQLAEEITMISAMVGLATGMGVMKPYEILSVPLKLTHIQQDTPCLLLIWADEDLEISTHLVPSAQDSFLHAVIHQLQGIPNDLCLN